METIRTLLETAGHSVSLLLESISVLCVVIGLIAAIVFAFKTNATKWSPLHTQIKIRFGSWLALALQFLLASDIVVSIVSPTYENLIKLGALAVIRTFLNYFLNKELYEQIKFQEDTKSIPDNAIKTTIIKKPSTFNT